MPVLVKRRRTTTRPIPSITLTPADGELPDEKAVREQLRRILRSQIFVRSDKLSRFLEFVVAYLLAGKANELKEYLIGCEVYGRKSSYDPSEDSIVRAEARRLRRKLQEYYENEGSADGLHIFLRSGSYIPLLRSRESLRGVAVKESGEGVLPYGKGRTARAGFLPFRNLSARRASSRLARRLPDEMAYRLRRVGGYDLVSPHLTACFNPQADQLDALMGRLGLTFVLEGSVEARRKGLRVTLRILDSTGRQLWTERIDTEASEEDHSLLECQIANEVSNRLALLVSSFQRESVDGAAKTQGSAVQPELAID